MNEANREPRRIALITGGTFLSFFLFGALDNLKGPVLPVLLRDLDWSYAQGGTLLMAAYLGFLAATLVTGSLADRAGRKAVLMLAGGCMMAGGLGLATLRTFGPLIAAMSIFGLGLGAVEVGANTVIVDVHPTAKGRFLNLLALFHGMGATIAPLAAGALLTQRVPWQNLYGGSVVLAASLPIYFFFLSYPRPKSGAAPDRGSLWQALTAHGMGWFYVMISAYVAAEIGFASWLVTFLQLRGQSTVESSGFLSLFFAFVMGGRFLASMVVERLGYLKLILACLIGAAVSLVLGSWGPPSLVILLPLTGFFFGPIFPTATAAVSELHKEKLGTVLGLFFAFGGLGGMAGPWLISLAADSLGMAIAFPMLLLFVLLMLAAERMVSAKGRQQA